LLFISRRDRHGVAGIPKFRELDALDDASGMDVEAGDDAGGKHDEVG
jgi:hypothetical protein